MRQSKSERHARIVAELRAAPALRVNELAEYHEVMDPGLDAEQLANRLRSGGCDTVRIVYHSNCASALNPAVPLRSRVRALLDGRWPTARASALHFMIVARKKMAR